MEQKYNLRILKSRLNTENFSAFSALSLPLSGSGKESPSFFAVPYTGNQWEGDEKR
jgi:hypothetical protein